MISNGLTITKISDSVFMLNGTVQDEDASVNVASLNLPHGTYSIRANGSNIEPFLRLRYFGEVSGDVTSYDRTIEVETESAFSFYIQAGVGYIANNYRFEIMLNAGSTVKPWEPYTGGQATPNPNYPQEIVSAGDGGSIDLTVSNSADQSQSLTISTPNGLPGIPSEQAYANYQDQTGAWRRCDIIDANSGVIKKYTLKTVLTGEESYIRFADKTNSFYVDVHGFPNIIPQGAGNQAVCSHFQFAANYTHGTFFIQGVNNASDTRIIFTTEYDNVDDLKQFIAQQYQNENPITVISPLGAPIETPLSEDEIAAYKALHTYDGATVVSTAEDVSGLDVRYVADVQKYIDDRLTAVKSHIQEIAAAQLNAQTGG